MNTKRGECFKWKPGIIYRPNDFNSKFVLLILNRPIAHNKEVIMSMWNRANMKVLVDGGANQWYDFLKAHGMSPSEKTFVPDFITGDLDSISTDVLNHFKAQGTNVIHTPNQNETDFTKALRFLGESCKEELSKVEAVIAIVETCGRFDQIMANINSLFKAKRLLDPPVYQMSGESLSWILWPGRHEIEVWPSVEEEICQKWCSLIPIGSCCSQVTTTGLKWNLDSQALEFGELVSTSNTYASGENTVSIDTNGPLVWSMETCGSDISGILFLQEHVLVYGVELIYYYRIYGVDQNPWDLQKRSWGSCDPRDFPLYCIVSVLGCCSIMF